MNPPPPPTDNWGMTEQATLWGPDVPGRTLAAVRVPVGTVELSVDAGTAGRFFAKCAPVDEDGHRWWLGAIDGREDGSGGYGRFQAGPRAGNQLVITTAHRYAWTLAHGPVPPGLAVRHRCDEPLCTAPEHLDVGTFAENSRDTIVRPYRAADLDVRGSAGRSRAIRAALLTALARGGDADPSAIGAAARAAMLAGDPNRDQLRLW